MKWQFLFLLAMTGFGWYGSLFVSPFVGLWTYYLFTVLRPQFLWQYALEIHTARKHNPLRNEEGQVA